MASLLSILLLLGALRLGCSAGMPNDGGLRGPRTRGLQSFFEQFEVSQSDPKYPKTKAPTPTKAPSTKAPTIPKGTKEPKQTKAPTPTRSPTTKGSDKGTKSPTSGKISPPPAAVKGPDSMESMEQVDYGTFHVRRTLKFQSSSSSSPHMSLPNRHRTIQGHNGENASCGCLPSDNIVGLYSTISRL